MLKIKNIKLLSKVQGLFDTITAPDIVLKLVIDDYFAFPQIKGSTKTYETVWSESQIPAVELGTYQTDYKLSFAVYREGALIGTATTTLQNGKSVKQQNDILDGIGNNAGKILYEIVWEYKIPKQGYVTYQQFVAFKQKNKEAGGKLGTISLTTQVQKKPVYVRQEEYQDCGGLCACFSAPKNRSNPANPPKQRAKDTHYQPHDELNSYSKPPARRLNPIFEPKASDDQFQKIHKNMPYMYNQSELHNCQPKAKGQAKRLVYFSKGYYLSK